MPRSLITEQTMTTTDIIYPDQPVPAESAADAVTAAGAGAAAGDAQGPQPGWQWLDQERGIAVPADHTLHDRTGLQTTPDEWWVAQPGPDRAYAVHMPTGIIAVTGAAGSPSRVLEISDGWVRHGSDLVHLSTGVVLRGPRATIGAAHQRLLARLKADQDSGPAIGGGRERLQLSRDDLLAWLLEHGGLADPAPGLVTGEGWQELIDSHGDARWVWNNPKPALTLPAGLTRGQANGVGLLSLMDSLSQLLQMAGPGPGQPAPMTTEDLTDWLENNLPVGDEALGRLLNRKMIDVYSVLPVLTSHFNVRVQMFQAGPGGPDDLPGSRTIQAGPLVGPNRDQDGRPTPILRLYWRPDHFDPIFPPERSPVPRPPAGAAPAPQPAASQATVTAVWQATRDLNQALEQVNAYLALLPAPAGDTPVADDIRPDAMAAVEYGQALAGSMAPELSDQTAGAIRAEVVELRTLADRLAVLTGAAPADAAPVGVAEQSWLPFPPGLADRQLAPAAAGPLGPASLPEVFIVHPAPGGGKWLAVIDVSGLASVIAWAGPQEPGTLHVGTPLDLASGKPAQAQMLSLRAVLQYVAGLPDDEKPRRVVLHQPWSHLTDGRAWARALGMPVTVPLADPDASGEVWMVHSLRYRWLSPVTGLTYFPALPGAAARIEVVVRPGLFGTLPLTPVPGRKVTYTLPANDSGPAQTLEIVPGGMFMRPGPPVDDEAEAFARDARESTEGWLFYHVGPLSVGHYNLLREAIPRSLHVGMILEEIEDPGGPATLQGAPGLQLKPPSPPADPDPDAFDAAGQTVPDAGGSGLAGRAAPAEAVAGEMAGAVHAGSDLGAGREWLVNVLSARFGFLPGVNPLADYPKGNPRQALTGLDRAGRAGLARADARRAELLAAVTGLLAEAGHGGPPVLDPATVLGVLAGVLTPAQAGLLREGGPAAFTTAQQRLL
ncbi:MAG TPA: hypothetical protein VK586_07150, partial [Streptosporangiaceae bacterium]|nr:hypothetical protein [Streptosporangiaceae bacterium]